MNIQQNATKDQLARPLIIRGLLLWIRGFIVWQYDAKITTKNMFASYNTRRKSMLNPTIRNFDMSTFKRVMGKFHMEVYDFLHYILK